MQLNRQLINGKNFMFNESSLENHKLHFTVIHPLFDEPEDKCDVENAAPMHITRSVKISLIALRAYLIIIILLAFYRMLVLAIR